MDHATLPARSKARTTLPERTTSPSRHHGPSLGTLPLDIDALLQTRLLVQANSGGGKSYCLRRLLEQSATTVQQLVIDLEGEFATLRERFDYVICAPHDADAVATPETAAALARALWESGANAILDICDLRAHDRTLFVRRFCEALIAAPKHVWHPTLVVIDECHQFAPQTGSSESLAAVIDLATRGRKRGLALVAATQRLSKLHKDVAAELLNKLIGRTALDVDVARAADELGLPRKEAWDTLRTLAPGEFFAHGPALSPTVVRTRIGPVRTTHPTGGQRMLAPPPAPSPALRSKLATLASIQRAAEEELTTVAALQAKVARLERSRGSPTAPPADREALAAEYARGHRDGTAAAQGELRTKVAEAVRVVIERARDVIVMMQQNVELPVADASTPLPPPASKRVARRRLADAPAAPASVSRGRSDPQQRILDALGWWASAGVAEPSRQQVAFVASYTVNGHFNNQIGALRQTGHIDYPGNNRVALTAAGTARAVAPPARPTKAELIARTRAILKGEPMRRIFDVLVEAHGVGVVLTREQCAAQAGYTVNGHFNNQIGALHRIGIADYPGKGQLALGAALQWPR